MENQNLLLTLGVGVSASFILFFVFYKGVRWSPKLAALATILIVQAVYIPFAASRWDGLDVFAIHFALFSMTAYGLAIITGNRDMRRKQMGGEAPKGWFHWVPATIVGFFLILVAVDSTIITLANKGASVAFMRQFLPEPERQSARNVTSAFPGTVANDFQKKYDLYNHYITQIKVQKERGWHVKDGWVEKPVVNKASLFRLQVLDKNETPIEGAVVEVDFLRPADNRLDAHVTLPEHGSGFYGQPVSLPAPGLWTMVIRITRGELGHEVKGDTWIEAQ